MTRSPSPLKSAIWALVTVFEGTLAGSVGATFAFPFVGGAVVFFCSVETRGREEDALLPEALAAEGCACSADSLKADKDCMNP